MGYAKRERKIKIHAKEHERKKSMLKSMREKKRESPYFQNQSKRARGMTKEFKNINLKFHTFALLNQSV
jgi:hypothetical protein